MARNGRPRLHDSGDIRSLRVARLRKWRTSTAYLGKPYADYFTLVPQDHWQISPDVAHIEIRLLSSVMPKTFPNLGKRLPPKTWLGLLELHKVLLASQTRGNLA